MGSHVVKQTSDIAAAERRWLRLEGACLCGCGRGVVGVHFPCELVVVYGERIRYMHLHNSVQLHDVESIKVPPGRTGRLRATKVQLARVDCQGHALSRLPRLFPPETAWLPLSVGLSLETPS